MSEANHEDKNTCSRCGGQRVASSVKDSGATTLRVKPVNASIFSAGADLIAMVCKTCGHVEFYVADMDLLHAVFK